MHSTGRALIAAVLFAAVASAPAAAQPNANQTKGQGQLAGGLGQFGTTYSLKSKFNFAILAARYTIEPYNAYEALHADAENKLLVLDLAVKNIDTGDNFFNTDSMFTLVDSKQQLITGGSVMLVSKGDAEAGYTLRPGQGLGQAALKDPLRIAFKVPLKARIVKIMVNKPRLNQNEEVFRYYVAGATKAEAGEAGDPKNIIAPLPVGVRDPSDPSGAIALDFGKGALATPVTSGFFSLNVESVAFQGGTLNGGEPEEGKKWAVATVAVRFLGSKNATMFDVEGGDEPRWQLVDADGEKYRPVCYRKASSDADADHEFKAGDEYRFRVVFSVPKDVKLKTFTFGTGQGYPWQMDASAIK